MSDSTMSNRGLWDSVCKTDPNFTKAFSRSGGFKGTAINPTYQVQKATEVFGPCGICWGFEETEHFVLQGVWFSKVKLWYSWKGERGEVSHWGATVFSGTNKHGSFVDEEAAKKSVTDALSKCLVMIGFGADIHLGLYDDNKYVNDRYAEFGREKQAASDRDEAEREAVESDYQRILNWLQTGNIKSRETLAEADQKIKARTDFSQTQRESLLTACRKRAEGMPDLQDREAA